MYRYSSRWAAVAIATAAITAACSQSPVSPTTRPSVAAGAAVEEAVAGSGRFSLSAAGDLTNNTAELTLFKICKVGNVSGTFTVSATPFNGGSPSVSTPLTVAAGTCKIAAVDTDAVSTIGANVTVTETSPGLQSISAIRTDDGAVTSFTFNNGDTLFLNAFHGYVVTFTNNVVQPPPPTGNAGCTPGYWKNHTDSWPAPYTTSTSFNSAFGIGTNWFSNSLTLLEATDLNGGGVNALARHAAAALLNAAAGISPLTVQQVIDRVQATYNGSFGVEATKDYFAARNELGCTLN